MEARTPARLKPRSGLEGGWETPPAPRALPTPGVGGVGRLHLAPAPTFLGGGLNHSRRAIPCSSRRDKESFLQRCPLRGHANLPRQGLRPLH